MNMGFEGVTKEAMELPVNIPSTSYTMLLKAPLLRAERLRRFMDLLVGSSKRYHTLAVRFRVSGWKVGAHGSRIFYASEAKSFSFFLFIQSFNK